MRRLVYILYIMTYSSLKIVLCLCRRTVYVTLENMERLGSSCCVKGGDYDVVLQRLYVRRRVWWMTLTMSCSEVQGYRKRRTGFETAIT